MEFNCHVYIVLFGHSILIGKSLLIIKFFKCWIHELSAPISIFFPVPKFKIPMFFSWKAYFIYKFTVALKMILICDVYPV